MTRVNESPRLPENPPQGYLQGLVRALVDWMLPVARKVNALASGRISAIDGIGTAPPTTGQWLQGDKITNSAPTNSGSGVVLGWVCVASGTPGTWAEMRAQGNSYRLVAVSTITALSATLDLSMADDVVSRCNAASAQTITVPANSTVAFPIGSVVTLRQVGAGQLLLALAGGVTLNVPTGFVAKSRGRYCTIMLHKVGTDEWDLLGDLATS